MKIAMVNMTSYGSTGNIMFQLADKCRENGMCVRTYSPVPFSINQKAEQLEDIDNHIYWGSRIESAMHCYLGVLSGGNGCFSFFGTRALIKSLKDFDPDVIHLHNLHHFCINLPMLFGYIKKQKKRVIWTLHDCWAFTGKCTHFELVRCEKWKTGCKNCPQLPDYPKSFIDVSTIMYRKKKEWFSGIDDLTLVTPSRWLANHVGDSFLKDYKVEVINNGIDLSVFKLSENGFREEYNCQNKKIVLGVAFDWSNKKGLDVFCSLARNLDSKYQVVLVGTTPAIEMDLPDNIISIHKTHNQHELAQIYSAADVFVNPTREENYPSVNMEAIACGTPVVTFDTGGCGEIVDNACGSVIRADDMQLLVSSIREICEDRIYSKKEVCKNAERFNKQDRFQEYIKLYNN